MRRIATRDRDLRLSSLHTRPLLIHSGADWLPRDAFWRPVEDGTNRGKLLANIGAWRGTAIDHNNTPLTLEKKTN